MLTADGRDDASGQERDDARGQGATEPDDAIAPHPAEHPAFRRTARQTYSPPIRDDRPARAGVAEGAPTLPPSRFSMEGNPATHLAAIDYAIMAVYFVPCSASASPSSA
jgi:hypothetical protein